MLRKVMTLHALVQKCLIARPFRRATRRCILQYLPRFFPVCFVCFGETGLYRQVLRQNGLLFLQNRPQPSWKRFSFRRGSADASLLSNGTDYFCAEVRKILNQKGGASGGAAVALVCCPKNVTCKIRLRTSAARLHAASVTRCTVR